MNTVRNVEVSVLSVENPLSYMVASSTGSLDKTMLERSLEDAASFWMLTVTAAKPMLRCLLRNLFVCCEVCLNTTDHRRSAKMALTTVNANSNLNPNAKHLCPSPKQLCCNSNPTLNFNFDSN